MSASDAPTSECSRRHAGRKCDPESAASLLLLTEFVLLYLNAAQPLYYGKAAKVTWATPHLVSIFGVLEATGSVRR